MRLALATLVAALVLGSAVVSRVPAAQPSNDPPPSARPRVAGPLDTASAAPSRCTLKTAGNTDGLQLTLTAHDRVLVTQRVRRHPRGQPDVPSDPDLQRLSLDDFPADANGVRVVPVDLTPPRHPPFGERRVPRRGAAPRRQRHARRRVRHPRRGRRSRGRSSEAARRGVGLATGGPARPRARRHARRRPSSASSRPRADSGVKPRRSPRTPTCRSPSRRARRPSTRGCRSRRSSTELGAGVAALQRASPRDQVLAGSFVPLDLPSLYAAGLAGTLGDELDRGREKPRDVLQRPLRPEHGDARRASTRRPSTRSATRRAPGSSSTVPPSTPTPVGSPPTRPALLGRTPGELHGRSDRASPPIPGSRAFSTVTRHRRSVRPISSARSQ